jgi:predicted esterase YcpF (UPF0227 family)
MQNQIEHDILAPQFDYDLNNLSKSINELINAVNEYSPDIIISSSFGAMITLLVEIQDVISLFVNPCLDPSKSVVRIHHLNAKKDFDMTNSLHKIECCLSKYIRQNHYFVFAKNDELFGEYRVKRNIDLVKTVIPADNIHIVNTDSHKMNNDLASVVANIILSLK